MQRLGEAEGDFFFYYLKNKLDCFPPHIGGSQMFGQLQPAYNAILLKKKIAYK